jgi:hypothetical protein
VHNFIQRFTKFYLRVVKIVNLAKGVHFLKKSYEHPKQQVAVLSHVTRVKVVPLVNPIARNGCHSNCESSSSVVDCCFLTLSFNLNLPPPIDDEDFDDDDNLQATALCL